MQKRFITEAHLIGRGGRGGLPELLITLVFITKPCGSVTFTPCSMKSRLLLRAVELLRNHLRFRRPAVLEAGVHVSDDGEQDIGHLESDQREVNWEAQDCHPDGDNVGRDQM